MFKLSLRFVAFVDYGLSENTVLGMNYSYPALHVIKHFRLL
jgi:hypothetical protein